jgi:hypothetical protein
MDPIPLDEMYLLAVVEKAFHPLQIYKNLTQQDTKAFKKTILDQFLANYHGLVPEDIEKTIFQHPLYISNDVFTYEDLLEFEWFNPSKNTDTNTKLTKIPLGFRFIEKPHDLDNVNVNINKDLFATNPYDILHPYVYKPSNFVPLQPFPYDFLFKYGKIVENTLYVCLLPNVSAFLEKNNHPDSILDIYFPKVKESSEPELNFFWQEQKLVDMFYDIYENESVSNPMNYRENGIYSFHFILHPEITNKLPLETIFKNIHASIQIPLILYNPGLRREKIMRLYYTAIAKNGNKYDFVSVDDDKIKLSAKTTKKDAKVCPQVIGQPSKKKFCEFFGIDLHYNLEQIKNYIELNVKSLLEIYALNTFDCPIVYYNKHKNMILFVKLKESINWTNYNISFSHIIKNKKWNESSCIIINGITIGEFQIHNHRDCIKFRWSFEKLLNLFNDNFEIVDLSL